MSFQLGVLIIHGIGSQTPAYANQFIKDLQEKIRLYDKNPDVVKMMPTTWATEIQPDEEELWRNVSKGEPLNFGKLRKFLISYVGDSVAYAGTPNKSNGLYHKIHRNIHETIEKLYIDLSKQDKPMIIIAHSFGTQIISDYIWDRQKAIRENTGDFLADNPFESMQTLVGLFTFGSCIPFFTLGYHPLQAIEFPIPQLPEEWKSKARWFNFYDVDDVLGYPLKDLSESYNRSVHADIEVNVGNWLQSWNPLCHFGYWRDDDCLNSIAEFISGWI